MRLSGNRRAGVVRPGRERWSSGRSRSERGHVDPAVVARRLSEAVRWEDAFDVTERSWRLIAQTLDFDAWLISWPRGGTVDLHDHGGSRGALHVISGSLIETTPRHDEGGHVVFARREVRPDSTLAFDLGHVHDVRNEARGHALSLHVYSPPLRSMTHYDCIENQLRPREVERVSLDRTGPLTEQPLEHLVAP